MIHHRRCSRRSLVSKVGLLGLFSSLSPSLSQAFANISPIDLESGLEIRDYRLFPTKDVMRFLVEVHNTTDWPMETPAVGVILDHLPENEDFGVAAPSGSLLLPHSSAVLIGVAPTSLESNENWGDPRWYLCQQSKGLSSSIEDLADITVVPDLEQWNDGAVHIYGAATNPHTTASAPMVVEAVCYDHSNRICGIVRLAPIVRMPPQETQNFHIWVGPQDDFISNPFVLLDSPTDLKVVMSPQYAFTPIPPSCPIVMPWRR